MMDDPPQMEGWLRRLGQGDQQALAELFAYYGPRLRQMVRLRMDSRLVARVDVSDVLQEVYLDAARQVESYLREPGVGIYVWLRSLAWERLLKLQRRHLHAECRAVDRQLPLPAESSALLAKALLAQAPTPSQALLQEEVRRRVQTALTKLGTQDREVILLRDFEGMANAEVAQALGLSPSGATMRYGRALYRLKEILIADLAASRTFCMAGNKRPIKTAMIAMTTSNSMSVKAVRARVMVAQSGEPVGLPMLK
jgi:RNA polymerase sigma-70 factor (ECF subfamily)